MLLKEVNEGNSFLVKHLDRFEDFTFYLEIYTPDKHFVSIKRSVVPASRVSLKLPNRSVADLTLGVLTIRIMMMSHLRQRASFSTPI